MQIKSLCCAPWTYTVLYINYFSIKLEEKREVKYLKATKSTKDLNSESDMA